MKSIGVLLFCVVVIASGQQQNEFQNRFRQQLLAAQRRRNQQQNQNNARSVDAGNSSPKQNNLGEALKTPNDVVDIREAVHQNFVRQKKVELKKYLAIASPDCKKIVMRNSAFLAKGCLPAITIAIKNAPENDDIFETLRSIFVRVMDVTSGNQCRPKFEEYRNQLLQTGCNALVELVNEDIKRLDIARMLQRFQQSFANQDQIFETFEEMKEPNCSPNLESFASYTANSLSGVCPKTARALQAFVAVNKN